MVKGGTVVAVETRPYRDRDGNEKVTFDAFLAPDNPRFSPDRISGPEDLVPTVGETVEYVVSVQAKVNRANNPYLSVWCVERLDAGARALKAVGAAGATP